MAQRYWAFISYSHRDASWCKWLHGALETFRIPSRLVGRETRIGKVPKRLFPVFRDRDELPGSSELGQNLRTALGQSEYLIVICSPHAASSRWVSEEVRLFKALGREDRVLALIVDGEPNGSDKPERGLAECFPEALRHRVDASGAIMPERVEPIAADVRKGNDSRRSALLKIVAGIVGVGYDELQRRDRQRTLRVRAAYAAAALAGFVFLASVASWYVREERLDSLEERGRVELVSGEPARAAVYLSEAYRLGRKDDSLLLMLGIAMPHVEKALATVQAHDGAISDMKVSPDGAWLVSSGRDKRVRLWDAATGAALRDLRNDESSFSTLEFSPDGRTIVGVARGKVRTWSADSGEVLREASLPATPSLETRLGPGGRHVYRRLEGKVEIWSVAEGRMLGEVPAREIVKIAENPSGSLVVIFDTEKEIIVKDQAFTARVFELPTLRKRFDFPATGTVWAWDFGSGGERLAFVTRAGEIAVWDLANRRRTLESRYPSHLRDVRFSPDESEILVANSDGTAKVWDAATGWLRQSLDGHRGWVTNAFYLPGASRILTRGADGTLRLWDRALGDELVHIETHKELNLRGLPAAGGRTVVSSNARLGLLSFWSLERTEPSRTITPDGQRLISVEISPRGNRMLATSDMDTRLWSFPALEPLARYEGAQATFTREGKLLVSFEHEGRLALVDTDSLREEASHRQPGPAFPYVVDGQDPSEYLAFGTNGTVVRWKPGSQATTIPLPPEAGNQVWVADWTADKERLLFTNDRSGGVVRLSDGKLETAYRRVGDRWGGAKFDPAGNTIYSIDGWDLKKFDARSGAFIGVVPLPATPFTIGRECRHRFFTVFGQDGSITVLNAASGERVAQLEGHIGNVIGVACDAAARFMYTSSVDGTSRVYRLADGKPLAVFGSRRMQHYGVSASPDGRFIATTGADGAARIWSIEPERRAPEVVAASVRCRVPWGLAGLRLERRDPKSELCATIGR